MKNDKKNEHFLASNAIDFGKKAWKILNNRLYLEEKKHIIMQKLDGPLKGLARVSIYNSNFLLRHNTEFSILKSNIYISYFLIPNFFFHFVKLVEFQTVLGGHLSPARIWHIDMIYRLASRISNIYCALVYFRNLKILILNVHSFWKAFDINFDME